MSNFESEILCRINNFVVKSQSPCAGPVKRSQNGVVRRLALTVARYESPPLVGGAHAALPSGENFEKSTASLTQRFHL
jgi:hypothetical protein